jgi:hypothetical protein
MSVVTEVTGDEYSYLRFIIISRNTAFSIHSPMLQINTAIRLQHVFSFVHTLQIGLGRVAPACHEHFQGGVPKQVTSSLHGITWRDAKPRVVDTSK